MNITNNDLANFVKTAVYYADALNDFDFDAAQLKLVELKIALNNLEKQQVKLHRKQKLIDLVKQLQKQGVCIDFAINSLEIKKCGMTAITPQ